MNCQTYFFSLNKCVSFHFACSVIGFSCKNIFVVTYDDINNRPIIMIKQIKIQLQAKKSIIFTLAQDKG